jgi:hypothetical protein
VLATKTDDEMKDRCFSSISAAFGVHTGASVDIRCVREQLSPPHVLPFSFAAHGGRSATIAVACCRGKTANFNRKERTCEEPST